MTLVKHRTKQKSDATLQGMYEQFYSIDIQIIYHLFLVQSLISLFNNSIFSNHLSGPL